MILDPDVCQRAAQSRDARFDGVFFVGITTTHIYCRPICPSRTSHPSHRRFFDSAARAEAAGFRPCLRCRPELAPGLALCDSVSRLARGAALRIAGGALNGHSVATLAREFSVSERHLRRSMEQELGVSPIGLAQTHRLLLAKQLLGETTLPVTRVAYTSGFQSLRRFNWVFRERYGLSPNAVRRARAAGGAKATDADDAPTTAIHHAVRLSLGYRAPFAWDALVGLLVGEAVSGVEKVGRGVYARTVRLAGHEGVIVVNNAAQDPRKAGRPARTHLDVALSPALLPVLMPLLARLRQFFDLDSRPAVADAHPVGAPPQNLAPRHRGLRVPGALDGFEVALRTLVGAAARSEGRHVSRLSRVVRTLGEPIVSGDPELTRTMPTAERIAEAGARRLRSLGVPARSARALAAVARAASAGDLTLDPGADPTATHRALLEIDGITDQSARTIVMRAIRPPISYSSVDRVPARAAGGP